MHMEIVDQGTAFLVEFTCVCGVKQHTHLHLHQVPEWLEQRIRQLSFTTLCCPILYVMPRAKSEQVIRTLHKRWLERRPIGDGSQPETIA